MGGGRRAEEEEESERELLLLLLEWRWRRRSDSCEAAFKVHRRIWNLNRLSDQEPREAAGGPGLVCGRGFRGSNEFSASTIVGVFLLTTDTSRVWDERKIPAIVYVKD